MHWEVEQKFRLTAPETVRSELLALGVHFEPAITQVDRYFQHPVRDFAKTDEALRLRQVGERNFITYKGPKIDPLTKTRRELELPLPDGPAITNQYAELLMALGFSPAGTVRKARQVGKISRQGKNIE